MIKLNNVDKKFNKGKKNEIHVLNDVNLTFPDKGLVVLLGASGSGKTTLLNVIGGLDKIDSGSISIRNKEVSNLDTNEWDELRNEQIGYIFQNYNLQPRLSVYDNVAFVLKMVGITDVLEIDRRVSYILKALGMYDFRKKKALQLSGGQQQRVAIARALVKNPDIVIADEPTGNLDSKNTTDIMNIIKEIAKEKLVVLVTHERHLADFYGNRIIEIVDGKIVSDIHNEQVDDHGLVDDQVIYLKDLNETDNISGKLLNVGLFSDQEINNNIKVDLIFKNNTLYLNVDSSIKNIKLANSQEGLVIKDEHYVRKTRSELLETEFDTNILDHSNLEKEKHFVVSSKRNIKLAISKVLSFGRKGKLMLASFFLSGVVVAFAMALLFSILIINPNIFVEDGTVRLYQENASNQMLPLTIPFEELEELINDDYYVINEINYYDDLPTLTLSVDAPSMKNNELTRNGTLIIEESLNKKEIIKGRNPEKTNEILISEGMAESFLSNKHVFAFYYMNGSDFGIWNFDDILFEEYLIKYKNQSIPIKIVGIIKQDSSNIYIKDALYDEMLLIDGYASRQEAYEKAGSVTIFSNDKETLLNQTEKYSNLNAVDIYYRNYKVLKGEANSKIPTFMPVIGLFIAFTFIGFEFIIRSSMISRINEIGIYRALGVKRIEIVSMFFYEIVILTTVSTLIGYLVGFYVISLMDKSLFAQLNMFSLNIISFIVGFIFVYGTNILAGLLPVFSLLRKTPAQILTQYDI